MDIPAKVHNLKTWIEFFDAIWRQEKTFEVRKDDRGFEVGDFLNLQRYDHENDIYTGDELLCKITYKLNGGQFGIQDGFCVLGLSEPITII